MYDFIVWPLVCYLNMKKLLLYLQRVSSLHFLQLPWVAAYIRTQVLNAPAVDIASGGHVQGNRTVSFLSAVNK